MHVNFHDIRLLGNAPGADFNLDVGPMDPLAGTLSRIRQYALNQTGPITMDIMCHGYETHNDTRGGQSVIDGFGGGGLQLCRENLRHANISATAELNGVVETITVYACSAAETRSGYEGTSHDGQTLFREMASHTGAVIYAADATQWYWRQPVNTGNSSTSVIDFRRFEGNVYRFTPDGNVSVVEANQLTAH